MPAPAKFPGCPSRDRCSEAERGGENERGAKERMEKPSRRGDTRNVVSNSYADTSHRRLSLRLAGAESVAATFLRG